MLQARQDLASPNGQYTLTMQADGNLVICASDGKALWASGTKGTEHLRLVQNPLPAKSANQDDQIDDPCRSETRRARRCGPILLPP